MPIANSNPSSLGGGVISHGKNTSSVSNIVGTTFGTGSDLLAAALTISADGVSDYAVSAYAPDWRNATSGATIRANLNLDSADGGIMGSWTGAAVNQDSPMSVSTVISAPSAGSHTINVRVAVSAGTGLVAAGSGGAGTNLPILVTVQKLV